MNKASLLTPAQASSDVHRCPKSKWHGRLRGQTNCASRQATSKSIATQTIPFFLPLSLRRPYLIDLQSRTRS